MEVQRACTRLACDGKAARSPKKMGHCEALRVLQKGTLPCDTSALFGLADEIERDVRPSCIFTTLHQSLRPILVRIESMGAGGSLPIYHGLPHVVAYAGLRHVERLPSLHSFESSANFGIIWPVYFMIQWPSLTEKRSAVEVNL